jgi:putative membrane protein
MRVLSMIWAIVRLYGFRLVRAGEDLRSEYGLLTRVTAAIPLRRVQALTVREGPLHRVFGRASVRVDTAGAAGGEESAASREDLAPLIARERVPALVHEVIPGIDVERLAWLPVARGAFRRVLIGSSIVPALAAAGAALVPGSMDLFVLPVLAAWAVVHARLYVASLGWAVSDDAVFFRHGWAWKRLTIAPIRKIQVVALRQSPFDRRARMARVAVDTAGGGSESLEIPYLAIGDARRAFDRLARGAGRG